VYNEFVRCRSKLPRLREGTEKAKVSRQARQGFDLFRPTVRKPRARCLDRTMVSIWSCSCSTGSGFDEDCSGGQQSWISERGPASF
jgi:hypothetical protein